MRISNNMIYSQVLINLQKNTEELDNLYWQSSSLKKIRYASDGPTETVKQMNLKSQQSKIEKYLSNIVDAEQWLNTQDNTLNDAVTILQRAHTLTIQAANDTYTASDRKLIAEEINQILESLVTVANTTLGGSFLYGGTQNLDSPFNEKPFAVTRGQSGGMVNVITNVEYKGDFQPIYREVEEGIRIQINQNGNEVFYAAPYSVQMPDLGFSDASTALKFTGFPDKGYFSINNENFFYNVDGKYQSDSLLDLKNKINERQMNVTASVEGTYQGATGINGNDAFTSSGSFYVNGVQINVVAGDTKIQVINKINNVSSQTGVTASINSEGRVVLSGGVELTYSNQYNNLLKELGLIDTTKITGKYSYLGDEKTQITAGSIFINGVEIQVNENATFNEIINSINAQSGLTGVSAVLTADNKLQLTAADLNGLTLSQVNTNALKVIGLVDSSDRIRTDLDTTNGSVLSNYTLKLTSRDSHQFFLNDRGSGQLLKALNFIDYSVNNSPQTSPNNISSSATVVNYSIFQVLIQVRDDMLNSNSARLNGQDLELLDSSITNLLKKRAEVGAKVNRLETIDNRLNTIKLNNQEILSEVSDVDVSEIILKLSTLENVQKASLSIAARIFNLSLMDFLS
ncbi:MAG TPA: flagellar hook-associated protein FlgL [bacterium]|nr:flagellar hook-associated protein FlgL [bacterium]HOL46788.1 flagellar hook-associated protein FlgL [bacterium]